MSIKMYPVHEVLEKAENYIVKINGEIITPDTARVSAHPFNRRWPGHQRQKEQPELINFVSFACDETVELEIFPLKSFENCVVHLLLLGIVPEITDAGSIKNNSAKIRTHSKNVCVFI